MTNPSPFLPTTSNDQPIAAWKKRLPMQLTWGRMAVCPFMVTLLWYGGDVANWVCAVLFIAASITDWFDGYFARKYHATSNLGKFMDPIADKVLVASALVMLIPSGRVGPVLVLILLMRDILIGGIRAVAAADRVVIDAKSAGKWKTGIQMVAIPALLIQNPVLGFPVVQTGIILLWISVILSVISGIQYIQIYSESKKRLMPI